MIGDPDLAISKLYDMLPASAGDTSEGRTAADNQTVRTVYVIGPDKKIKLSISYPMTTGRNFDEILRVVDSLQLTAKHKVATPVNWKHGEDVIIAGSVSDEDAKKIYPNGWKIAEALHPHRAAAARLKRSAISNGPRQSDELARGAGADAFRFSSQSNRDRAFRSSTRHVEDSRCGSAPLVDTDVASGRIVASGGLRCRPRARCRYPIRHACGGMTEDDRCRISDAVRQVSGSVSRRVAVDDDEAVVAVSRNSSLIQMRSCGSCASSGTPGRMPAWHEEIVAEAHRERQAAKERAVRRRHGSRKLSASAT